MNPNYSDDATETEFMNLDYPLDSSNLSGAQTSAFPPADTGSMEALAPLPFGEDPGSSSNSASSVPSRGTTDLALFLARIVVGILIGLHTVRSMFGVFGGAGLSGRAEEFSDAGFAAAEALAMAVSLVGAVAALLLIVGLITPLAVSALIIATVLTLIAEVSTRGPMPLIENEGAGLETPILYLTVLVVLLFAGPGRWALDRKWSWSYRPRFSGFVWLLVAIAGVAAVWLLLNGGNPFANADSTVTFVEPI